MWGQQPGDVRQKQGFRKEAFPGLVAACRSLKTARQGFSSTKVTLVGEWTVALLKTGVVLTVVLDLWSVSNQSVWGEVKTEVHAFRYKYPAVGYQLCEILSFLH